MNVCYSHKNITMNMIIILLPSTKYFPAELVCYVDYKRIIIMFKFVINVTIIQGCGLVLRDLFKNKFGGPQDPGQLSRVEYTIGLSIDSNRSDWLKNVTVLQ